MYINGRRVLDEADGLSGVISELQEIKGGIAHIRGGVDWEIRDRRNIDHRFINIDNELQDDVDSITRIRNFCYDAVDEYDNCERRVANYADELKDKIYHSKARTVSINEAKFMSITNGNKNITKREASTEAIISLFNMLSSKFKLITDALQAKINGMVNVDKIKDVLEAMEKAKKEYDEIVDKANKKKECVNEYDKQVYIALECGDYVSAFQIDPELLSDEYKKSLKMYFKNKYNSSSASREQFINMVNGMLYQDTEHIIMKGTSYASDYIDLFTEDALTYENNTGYKQFWQELNYALNNENMGFTIDQTNDSKYRAGLISFHINAWDADNRRLDIGYGTDTDSLKNFSLDESDMYKAGIPNGLTLGGMDFLSSRDPIKNAIIAKTAKENNEGLGYILKDVTDGNGYIEYQNNFTSEANGTKEAWKYAGADAKNTACEVISFWNNGAEPLDGIHTVAAIKDSDGDFRIYNTYSKDVRNKEFDSILAGLDIANNNQESIVSIIGVEKK